jgi:xylulokinase
MSVNTTEGGAFGAALLASVAVDVYSDIQSACSATIITSDLVEPGANVAAYQERYEIYRKLYPALKDSFSAIAALD